MTKLDIQLKSIEEEILIRNHQFYDGEIQHLLILANPNLWDKVIKSLKKFGVIPLEREEVNTEHYYSDNFSILKQAHESYYCLDIILNENGFQRFVVFECNLHNFPAFLQQARAGNLQGVFGVFNADENDFFFSDCNILELEKEIFFKKVKPNDFSTQLRKDYLYKYK